MKTKIVLLGANGQLGSDILSVFADLKSFELIPVLRRDLDVSDTGRIGAFLDGIGDIGYLINCTSYHKTDECEDYPELAFRINAIAPREMAKWCSRRGSALIHFSTDYVFSGNATTPYKEEDAVGPLNVYGNSKASGEFFIRTHHDRHYIIRVSSLFGKKGASGKGGNFAETMIRLARQGVPLKVVHDQRMSPTHTLDIAKAVRALIEQSAPHGTYHCCSSGECSWYEFAAEIFARLRLRADLTPVASDKYGAKAKRPAYSVLDNAKIGVFHPMPHWRKAISEYLRLKGHLAE